MAIEPLNAEILKENFLRECKESKLVHGLYNAKMIRALKEMADNDVWPDWRFGDIDCNVWSILRGS